MEFVREIFQSRRKLSVVTSASGTLCSCSGNTAMYAEIRIKNFSTDSTEILPLMP